MTRKAAVPHDDAGVLPMGNIPAGSIDGGGLSPSYSRLAERLDAAADRLFRTDFQRWSAVMPWAELWATGLRLLDAAGPHAAAAAREHLDGMRGIEPGPMSPAAAALFARQLQLTAVESYHELALAALGQPLIEAIASASLRVPTGRSALLDPGRLAPLNWDAFLPSGAMPRPWRRRLTGLGVTIGWTMDFAIGVQYLVELIEALATRGEPGEMA